MITYDDFTKLDLRVATIKAAERVEGSERLIKLQLDLGELDEAGLPAGRQVIGGIGKSYEPDALVGTQIIIVANLEPRKLMGQESNGMLLATCKPLRPAQGEPKEPEGEEIILLRPESPAPPGSKIN